MHVVFVARGFESIGISQLSAFCKKEGHTVSLVFSHGLFNDNYNLNSKLLGKVFDDKKRIIKKIRKEKPDLIGFSSISPEYEINLQLAREIKKRNKLVKIVFGGIHIALFPEDIIKEDAIDFAVYGDGEPALAGIIKAMKSKNYKDPIPNTYHINNNEIIKGEKEEYDIETQPFADKEIWKNHIKIEDDWVIMTSRGCPYSCSFCSNSIKDIKKKKQRRSVNSVIQELSESKKKYKIKYIDFLDDIFTCDKKWLKEFSEKYKELINIPYQCNIHPMMFDKQILDLLTNSGCVLVSIGIQTLDEKYKVRVLNRYDTTEKIKECLRLLVNSNLKFTVDHILGLPNEPMSSMEKARELYSEYTPNRIQTFWYQYLPKTKMTIDAIKTGEILESPKSFRDNTNIKKEDLIIYKKYEFIFKILPAIPKQLRKRIKIKHLRFIPNSILSAIAFLVDTINSLIFYKLARAYLKNIAFQILNHIKQSKHDVK